MRKHERKNHNLSMYSILQLTEKDLPELQQIANEFGIKDAKSFEKRQLIYEILDAQALASAARKVANELLKSIFGKK